MRILLVLYVLSFGPACWLTEAKVLDIESVAKAYRPLILLTITDPDFVGRPLSAWGSGAGMGKRTMFRLGRLVGPPPFRRDRRPE